MPELWYKKSYWTYIHINSWLHHEFKSRPCSLRFPSRNLKFASDESTPLFGNCFSWHPLHDKRHEHDGGIYKTKKSSPYSLMNVCKTRCPSLENMVWNKFSVIMCHVNGGKQLSSSLICRRHRAWFLRSFTSHHTLQSLLTGHSVDFRSLKGRSHKKCCWEVPLAWTQITSSVPRIVFSTWSCSCAFVVRKLNMVAAGSDAYILRSVLRRRYCGSSGSPKTPNLTEQKLPLDLIITIDRSKTKTTNSSLSPSTIYNNRQHVLHRRSYGHH